MRSSLRRVGLALAAALLAADASPLPASAVGSLSTVCEGTVSGTYSPALPPTPSAVPVKLTLGPSTLSCVGPATRSISLSASGDQPIGASCTGPVAFVGSGPVSTDTVGQAEFQWVGSGTALAQAWAFALLGPGVPPPLEAAGVAAVPDPGVATACLSGGVSTVTFTAVLVIVA